MSAYQADDGTLIITYDDQAPYAVKETIEIDFKAYSSTRAIDRRSEEAQNNKKIVIFGITRLSKGEFSFKFVSGQPG